VTCSPSTTAAPIAVKNLSTDPCYNVDEIEWAVETTAGSAGSAEPCYSAKELADYRELMRWLKNTGWSERRQKRGIRGMIVGKVTKTVINELQGKKDKIDRKKAAKREKKRLKEAKERREEEEEERSRRWRDKRSATFDEPETRGLENEKGVALYHSRKKRGSVSDALAKVLRDLKRTGEEEETEWMRKEKKLEEEQQRMKRAKEAEEKRRASETFYWENVGQLAKTANAVVNALGETWRSIYAVEKEDVQIDYLGTVEKKTKKEEGGAVRESKNEKEGASSHSPRNKRGVGEVMAKIADKIKDRNSSRERDDDDDDDDDERERNRKREEDRKKKEDADRRGGKGGNNRDSSGSRSSGSQASVVGGSSSISRSSSQPAGGSGSTSRIALEGGGLWPGVPEISSSKPPVKLWTGPGSNPDLLPGVKMYSNAAERRAAGDDPDAPPCPECRYLYHLRNT
jgi:hypothetical protein